ncbi:hypothetical protein GUITHDRAFT_133611 [Guillardia theta CCMP2712]|uniref:Right handed beta helix domain-containing protein n=1 Tax=Guillardia theta (strain CCMP2712) TaxID=905079 RepID=L1JWF9_GUITC|nr:hypothetical protein GUITHDRAFT_133611 [Guillardia theta CCMP2712]EKX52540.1 hypothetical protein GUITHDRAFT_133611 [Guillardia theta CCMP2712]|eukprot:XP_005839520.1 hypothetical protein GUITHDRAFT_133611 [Guillardia theta CCMP2712]
MKSMKGIAVEGVHSNVQFRNCKISQNRMQGLAISKGNLFCQFSNLTYNNLANAAVFGTGSVLYAADCQILLSNRSGATAQEGGSMILKSCNVSGNSGAGVLSVHEGSRALVYSSTLLGNSLAPFAEVMSGRVEMERTLCSNGSVAHADRAADAAAAQPSDENDNERSGTPTDKRTSGCSAQLGHVEEIEEESEDYGIFPFGYHQAAVKR